MRHQAETKQGEKRFAVLYPKYKEGGHIVRKLMENSMLTNQNTVYY